MGVLGHSSRMDFSLTEDQRLFSDSVQGFAERYLAEGALARAHAGTFPWDIAKLMAEHGLLGITIAEADGGQAQGGGHGF